MREVADEDANYFSRSPKCPSGKSTGIFNFNSEHPKLPGKLSKDFISNSVSSDDDGAVEEEKKQG